ncbi:MAG: hypothetical protein JWR68_3411 [Polaromonas sp.]|nr:hypothetical protein [Polaromonas sp.]
MNRVATDQDHRKIISGYLGLIEHALAIARTHMAGGAGSRPEMVDCMVGFIKRQAERTQEFKWPDPAARLAEAAKHDLALQKLLKRVTQMISFSVKD